MSYYDVESWIEPSTVIHPAFLAVFAVVALIAVLGYTFKDFK